MIRMILLEKILKSYLGFRTRPEIIDQYFRDKKIQASPNCQTIDLNQIRVASAQIPLYLISNPLEWVEMIDQQVKEAAQAGAQLIVFPENITLHLLGLIPGINKLSVQALKASTSSTDSKSAPITIADGFRIFGSAVEKLHFQTMSHLAKNYQVYIMGGSSFVPNETGQVMNVASLFGPQGQIIGSQAKNHLLPIETEWGLCRGTKFQVFQTTLGNIAFPICMDATYFETFRILSLLGADLVIVPIANPEDYHPWKALRGIWPRVQESYVYGIKSALVGKDFLGLNFTGKAGIFAPLELHGNDGVLALADNPHKKDLIIADLNIIRLRETKEDRLHAGEQNPDLYYRYFSHIYNEESLEI